MYKLERAREKREIYVRQQGELRRARDAGEKKVGGVERREIQMNDKSIPISEAISSERVFTCRRRWTARRREITIVVLDGAPPDQRVGDPSSKLIGGEVK